MELYYVITISDRDRAEILANIYQTAGTGMVLTKLGRGTATGEQLSSYGLDATEKAIVSTVADAEQTRQIFKLSKRRLFIDCLLYTSPASGAARWGARSGPVHPLFLQCLSISSFRCV